MKNANVFSFASFYIFLWLLYYFQTVVFGGAGSIYAKIIDATLIVVSLYYLFYTVLHFKLSRYLKSLIVLLLMFTLYGLIRIMLTTKYVYLQTIFNSMLPIFPFYVFTRKGIITKQFIKIWTIIFFVTATFQYFLYQDMMLKAAMEAGSDREEFTNNAGYFLLALIPLLAFFSDKKIIQFSGLLVVVFFVMLAMKRGAILITAIVVIWFLYYSLKSSNRRQKILVVFLGSVLIVIGYYFIGRLLENSDYFYLRVQQTLEGDSSGRDSIYRSLLHYFFAEAGPIQFLIGSGADATVRLIGRHAHNDWLEIAIGQGLIGVIVYAVYWLSFYKTYRKETAFDKEIHLALGITFIIYFLRTLFSMSYNDMLVYATLCIGYCIGMISENKNHSPQNDITHLV